MKRLVTGILIGGTFTVLAAGERQAAATIDRQTIESPCGTAMA